MALFCIRFATNQATMQRRITSGQNLQVRPGRGNFSNRVHHYLTSMDFAICLAYCFVSGSRNMCRVFRPFNLYLGPAAQFAGMVGNDQCDPETRRLVNVLRSSEARRFLILTWTKMSGALLATMAVVAGIHWQSLIWSFASSGFLTMILGGVVGCSIGVATENLRWAVRTWINPSAIWEGLSSPTV
jgi:VIT1/CCC1 family predicted Fe2+/Mn2+ transporter